MINTIAIPQKGVWERISDKIAFLEYHMSTLFLILGVLLMFWEVLSRYLFSTSLYWTTEWTQFCTTWAMLIGNALLIRLKGHISISALENALKSEKAKNMLVSYDSIVSVLFSLIFSYASCNMVAESYVKGMISESLLQTPMYIPYSMMIIAGVLMSIRSIENLVKSFVNTGSVTGWYKTYMLPVLLVLTVVVIILCTQTNSPLLLMGILMAVFLVLGVPITHVLGIATIIAISSFGIIEITGVANKMFWSINKYSLLAIPFFIVSGNIMARGNLGRYLLDFADSLLKRVRGGFAIAILFAGVVFAAISGASAASAAMLGVMALPMMEEKGYPREFGAGLIAAGGTLAIIIPPSGLMILYGATAEQSITDMFLAGIVPGLAVSLVLMIYVYVVSRAKGYGPVIHDFSWKNVRSSFRKAIWALIMPVAILGAIYGGICTPTEAAAVSVIYAAIVCLFIYRDVKPRQLWGIIYESVKTGSFILAITMTAGLFGFLIIMEQMPKAILELVLLSNIGKIAFLLLINLIVFILGFFMSVGAIVLIVVPIILPVVTALGVHPVHLGIMLMINLELAMLTPPVGPNLYVLSSVSNMPLERVIKGVAPFVVIMVVALLLIIFFPQISLLWV